MTSAATFSANECRELASVMHQLIQMMQAMNHRAPATGTATGKVTRRSTRKVTRRTTRPRTKASSAMECPAPHAAASKMKQLTKSPPATGGNTTGYVDATGKCVCPMKAAGPPPGFFKPGYSGPITRSMSTAMRKGAVPRRAVEGNKPGKLDLKVKARKQKVRRQNRKRPVMKKGKARAAIEGCS